MGRVHRVVLSLNVPVPGQVKRLAEGLRPALTGFDRIRDRHTMVCKRFEDDAEGGRARIQGRARQVLAGAGPFEARVTGIDVFGEPLAGPGPVVYLAVESPGLLDVHRRLVEEFGAVPAFEGESYVPHVTIARGGNPDALERILDHDVEPVTWTVSELIFWDGRYEELVGTVSLPA